MVLLPSRNELKYETNDDVYRNHHKRKGVINIFTQPSPLTTVILLPRQAYLTIRKNSFCLRVFTLLIGSGGDVAEGVVEQRRSKSFFSLKVQTVAMHESYPLLWVLLVIVPRLDFCN
jgi:hypothetical protein